MHSCSHDFDTCLQSKLKYIFWGNVFLIKGFHIAVSLFICSVINYRWDWSLVRAKMWHKKRSPSRVTDVLTTLWPHLWSFTRQKYGDLESVAFFSYDEKKRVVIWSVRLSSYRSEIRTTQNACIIQLIYIWIKTCIDRRIQSNYFCCRISEKSQHWWHWRERYDQSPCELFYTVFGLFLVRCAIRKYRIPITSFKPKNEWSKWRWG